jgi:hypothetical protein
LYHLEIMGDARPSAVCAICRKPIAKAADAVVTHSQVVHRACIAR